MKKSWKKLVCGLLCAALLWGSLPLQASAAWFSDVPWTAWYRRAVNELADMGIIAGTGGDKFSPNATLTRGAFVTMLGKSIRKKTILHPAHFFHFMKNTIPVIIRYAL